MNQTFIHVPLSARKYSMPCTQMTMFGSSGSEKEVLAAVKRWWFLSEPHNRKILYCFEHNKADDFILFTFIGNPYCGY